MTDDIRHIEIVGHPTGERKPGHIVRLYRAPMEPGENPVEYLAQAKAADERMKARGFTGIDEAAAENAQRQ